MSKRKRPVPKTVVVGENHYDFQLLRLVKCDDGIVRMELVPDSDAKMNLSGDLRRNIFVSGYLHESLALSMKAAAEVTDDEPSA